MTVETILQISLFLAVVPVLTIVRFQAALYLFLAFSCVLLSFSSNVVPPFASSSLLRVGAVFWLFLLLFHHSSDRWGVLSLGESHGAFIRSVRPFLWLFGLQLVLQLWIYLTNGWDWGSVAEALIGIGVGFAFAVLLVSSKKEIGFSLQLALGAFLGLGLMAGMLLPDTAVVQGRLAGAFANANSTGIVAAALVAVVGLRPRISLFDWVCLGAAATSIVWSASRTSAIVAMFFVVMLLVQQQSAFKRSVSYLLGLSATVVLIAQVLDGGSDQLLFRETQSRSAWDWALDMYRESPLTGHGYMLHPSGEELVSAIGSSQMTALVAGGAVGLGIVLLMMLVLMSFAIRAGYRSTVVVAGFMMHSVFESWLVAPAAPMMLLFLSILIAANQTELSTIPYLPRAKRSLLGTSRHSVAKHS